MLYVTHDYLKFLLKLQFNTAAGALGAASAALRLSAPLSLTPDISQQLADTLHAGAEMMERAVRNYPKPEFNLTKTTIDGKTVGVTEESVIDLPYCTLKRFRRDTGRNDPKVLLIAPMSGHYASLLRDTVKELLPSHDVYVTDWKNVRDVPVSAGPFGLEDYITYLHNFIHTIGPQTNLLAFSQSTVPALATVSLMEANNDPCRPLSMTLMGGPLDTRAAPTAVTRYAERHPLHWFEMSVTDFVPPWYPGAGQHVYPGFIQRTGLVMVDIDRHIGAHHDLYHHRRSGNHEEADKITRRYDDDNAVCDLPAKFYLDTVRQVFHEHALPKGRMMWKGQSIDPGKIRKTFLFTAEGGLDDITAPGQTMAAHLMCKNLPADRHFNHLEKGVNHYGLFSGPLWKSAICPRITRFIRASAAQEGLVHEPVSCDNIEIGTPLLHPCRWTSADADKRLLSLYNLDGGKDGKKVNKKPFSPR